MESCPDALDIVVSMIIIDCHVQCEVVNQNDV